MKFSTFFSVFLSLACFFSLSGESKALYYVRANINSLPSNGVCYLDLWDFIGTTWSYISTSTFNSLGLQNRQLGYNYNAPGAVYYVKSGTPGYVYAGGLVQEGTDYVKYYNYVAFTNSSVGQNCSFSFNQLNAQTGAHSYRITVNNAQIFNSSVTGLFSFSCNTFLDSVVQVFVDNVLQVNATVSVFGFSSSIFLPNSTYNIENSNSLILPSITNTTTTVSNSNSISSTANTTNVTTTLPTSSSSIPEIPGTAAMLNSDGTITFTYFTNSSNTNLPGAQLSQTTTISGTNTNVTSRITPNGTNSLDKSTFYDGIDQLNNSIKKIPKDLAGILSSNSSSSNAFPSNLVTSNQFRQGIDDLTNTFSQASNSSSSSLLSLASNTAGNLASDFNNLSPSSLVSSISTGPVYSEDSFWQFTLSPIGNFSGAVLDFNPFHYSAGRSIFSIIFKASTALILFLYFSSLLNLAFKTISPIVSSQQLSLFNISIFGNNWLSYAISATLYLSLFFLVFSLPTLLISFYSLGLSSSAISSLISAVFSEISSSPSAVTHAWALVNATFDLSTGLTAALNYLIIRAFVIPWLLAALKIRGALLR